MPWIHFHVGNKGVVKACCVANIPLGNINDSSLEDIWEGEKINILREKFAAGELDKRCGVCINMEATGGKSIRQETFEKFPDVDISEPLLPIYFDIRFSNVCNFRCRTCWHGASSKWFSDAQQLGRAIGQQAILKNIHDFQQFINKTGEALLEAQEIYFAGGEPLVTEEHYLLLEWLIAHKATNIRLRYNTNFSKLHFKQYDVLELWNYFPKVEILASIDGFGVLGEIIRKDMKWTDILKNREKIHVLPHIDFKIAPTVSVLNMRHLPALYKEVIQLNLIDETDLYINILERPQYYNIQIFPATQKAEINQLYADFFNWMTENNIPESIKALFQECLDYMNAKDHSQYWEQFLVETQVLDELRDEKLKSNHISI